MSDNFNLNQEVKNTKRHFSRLRNISSNKYFNKKMIVPVLIMLAIPLTVGLALVQQEVRSRASGPEIATVAIHPGSIEVNIETPPSPVEMSALAYDSQGNPVGSGVTYEWSISSTNEVGTLVNSSQSHLSQFRGLNYGCGVITVIARSGDQAITKSTVVTAKSGIQIPDCSTSTPEVSPTLEPIVFAEQQITILDYTPNVYVAPGQRVKLFTMRSDGALGFQLFGYPTSRGPGINYSVSSGGMAPGRMVDVYVEVNSNIPYGVYTGTPQLNTYVGSGWGARVSLPSDTVTVGAPTPTRLPSNTPIPTNAPTFTPFPTNTPIPTPTSGPNLSTLILNPTADAFVRSTNPTKNFGNTQAIETGTVPNEIGYLRFNLDPLAGKTIKKATLRLTVSDPTSQTQTLKRGSTNNWNETAITYNKRPALEANIRNFTANTKNQVLNLQATNAVNLRKGGNITFGITSSGNDAGAFYSRQSTGNNKPQLIVEYQ